MCNILKRLFITAAVIILLALPVCAVYAEDVMTAQTFTDDAGTALQYQIYIPDGKGPFPLLLYLHGSGHRGSDNTIQVTYEPGILSRVLGSEYSDCILIAPQCPEDSQWVDTPWADGSYSTDKVGESKTLRAVYELLLTLETSLPVDTARIYVTGISMGGFGTWDLIMRHPELFAAAIPVCGAGDPSSAAAIAKLPIWCFNGADDDVVPPSGTREMAAALESVGSTVYKYTEYPGVGHDCWSFAYSEPELLDWLFAQSKTGAQAVAAKAEPDNLHVAGYITAAVILLAAGAGVIGAVYTHRRRSGG